MAEAGMDGVALGMVNYIDDLPAVREKQSLPAADGRLIGVGFAMYLEMTGLGPSSRDNHPSRTLGAGRADRACRFDRASVRGRSDCDVGAPLGYPSVGCGRRVLGCAVAFWQRAVATWPRG